MLASLARGTLSLLSGMAARKVLGFLAIVLAVRIVPREAFGAYVLFEAILLLLVSASDFGLGLASTRLIAAARDDGERTSMIGSALAVRLASLTLFALMLLPARPLIHGIYRSPLLDTLTQWMPLLLFLTGSNDLLTHVLLGMHRHSAMALAQTVAGAAQLAGVLALVWLGHLGAVGLVWTSGLATAACAVLQLGVVAAATRIRPRMETLRRLVRFGIPLHANAILTAAFTRLDTFLLGSFVGPLAVASYGVAMKLPENAQFLFDSHRMVYYGTAAKHFSLGDVRGIANALETSVRWIAFLLFGGVVVAAVFGREIIQLVFSHEYVESAPALPLLMTAVSIYLINCLFGATLVAGARAGRVVAISLLTAITGGCANVLLIPRLGFIGAAQAAVITHGVAMGAYVLSLRGVGVRPRAAAILWPPALAALVLALHWLGPWRAALPARLAIPPLYALGCLLAGVVHKTDWHALRGILTARVGGGR